MWEPNTPGRLRRLVISRSQSERAALLALADSERRDLRAQATLLIRTARETRALLPAAPRLEATSEFDVKASMYAAFSSARAAVIVFRTGTYHATLRPK